MNNKDHITMSDDELISYITDFSTDNDRHSEAKPEEKQLMNNATNQQIVNERNDKEAQPFTQLRPNSGLNSFNVYSYQSFADLCKKPEPIRYLIDDYVQEGALLLDYGESGCGKSFVALDQACSIACPEIDSWHGMKIRHAPVIYFAGEGAKGLRKRCAIWAHEHNVNPESVQLFIIDEVFKLDDETDKEHSINNTVANIRGLCDNPGLVVVDTLNRYINGDENKAVDVGKFISACTFIIRELGCAVKIIHHVGNATENKGRPRGSSSLIAAVDIATLYDKIGENHIHIDQKKNKENQLKEGLVLKLRQCTLPPEWNNEYGNPTTSCVVELDPSSRHNEIYTPEPATKKKLTRTQIRARETYKEAASRFGIHSKDEKTGHKLAAVDLEDWRKVFYEMSSADNDNSKRTQFNVARRQLFETDNLLIKQWKEGHEYYCLDLEAEGEDTLRISIITALNTSNSIG